ncbi:MAG: glycosyltransferase family 2 protein [Paludibacteraceae bacterium]
MPTISVIVPVYNTADYLSRCVESIVNQIHDDLQIILIDDGSTDESGAMADEWQAKDSRIEVYHQPNQGQSAARNVGLQHAKGEYIAFVDSDDYIDSNYFSTMLQTADVTIDCVQTGYRRVKQNGEIIKTYRPKHFYQYTSPWGKMYRKTFIDRYHLRFPEGMIYEDVLFAIDLWTAHPVYMMWDYCGYNYTANPSSTTAVRNVNAEKVLFRALHAKFRTAKSVCAKMLILYTILRLKAHFLLK